MIEQEIPRKLVNLGEMCLSETFHKVRIGHNYSERFEVRSGLKQGDSLSPVLFNIALEYVIEKVMCTEKGLNMGDKIPVLGYADDLVLLGEDTETIQLNTSALIKTGKEIGLEFNTDKSKYMISSRNSVDLGDIDVSGHTFEHVEKFMYLGSIITRKNEIQEETKPRLKVGNACYYSVAKLLSSRLLSKNLKIRIYKTIILPTVLYGCETWPLTLKDEQRLKVVENKVLRKIFGPKRDEATGEFRRLNNAELRNLYPVNIIELIASRRLKWARKVVGLSEERIPRKLVFAEPTGRRPKGRPKRRWEDCVNSNLGGLGLNGEHWTSLCRRNLVVSASNLRVR